MPYALLVADIIMGASVLLAFRSLPPQVPLFYSRPAGEEQLADTWTIILLPLLLHFFYFLNIIIVKRYFSENEFVKKMIHYVNLFLVVIFTVIFVKIIFLVS
ncbi:hypothetical protein HY214_03700 [Candidatus Roizmanbacteria bacterium]|nr:hypothetical protein [Candidatus Roizmanbacteria bacterium]